MSELLKRSNMTDLEAISKGWSTTEITELLNQIKTSDEETLARLGEAPETSVVTHPNATPADVATWMKSQIDARAILYQDWAAVNIRRLFGEQFIYRNKNRNLAILRGVLIEFLRLTKY